MELDINTDVNIKIYSVRRNLDISSYMYYVFTGSLDEEMYKIFENIINKKKSKNEISKFTEYVIKIEQDPVELKEILEHENTKLINDTIYCNDTVSVIKNKIMCYLSDLDNNLKITLSTQHLWVKVYDIWTNEKITDLYNNIKEDELLSNDELREFSSLYNNVNYDEKIFNLSSISLDEFVNYLKDNKIYSESKKTLGILYKYNNKKIYYESDPLALVDNLLDKENKKTITSKFYDYENENLKNYSSILENTRILSNYGMTADYIINLNYIYDIKDIFNNLIDNEIVYSNFIKIYWYSIDKHEYIDKTLLHFDKKIFDDVSIFLEKENKIMNYYNNISKLDENKLKNIELLDVIIQVNYPGEEDFINLDKIFKILEVNENIPFIKYKGKDNKITNYKIYKKSLDYNSENFISKTVLKSWKNNHFFDKNTLRLRTTSKPNCLVLKILLDNILGKFDKKDYYTLNIYPDGKLEIRIYCRENNYINFSILENMIKNIQMIISNINKINYSLNHKKIIPPDINFLKKDKYYNSYNTKLVNFSIVINSKDIYQIPTSTIFKNNINCLSSLVLLNEEDTKKISNELRNFKYKKVNNFNNMNNMFTYITNYYNEYRHYDTNKINAAIIGLISSDWKMNENEAKKIYNEWKIYIKADTKILSTGSILETKGNPGILIRMLKKNLTNYKFIINNIEEINQIVDIKQFINNLLVLYSNKEIANELNEECKKSKVNTKQIENILDNTNIGDIDTSFAKLEKDKIKQEKNNFDDEFEDEEDEFEFELSDIDEEIENEIENELENELKNKLENQIENELENENKKNNLLNTKIMTLKTGSCERYLSKRLKLYDSQLFEKQTYSKKCQHKKQPIVLTQQEMNNIIKIDLKLSLKYFRNDVDIIIDNALKLKDNIEYKEILSVEDLKDIQNLIELYQGKKQENETEIIYNIQKLIYKIKNKKMINELISLDLPLKSYNYFLKLKSLKTFYYICPKIWCINCELSFKKNSSSLLKNSSLDLDENIENIVCPECGGKYIKNTKNKKKDETLLVKDKELGSFQVNPYYYAEKKDPKLCWPCCGNEDIRIYKNKQSKKKEKLLECESINNVKNKLKENELEKDSDPRFYNPDKKNLFPYSVAKLSNNLNNLFNNKDDVFEGITLKLKRNKSYYARSGVEYSENKSFLYALKDIYNEYCIKCIEKLGNKNNLNLLNNGEELVDLFVNNLTPYGFISVNYGDLITLFNTNKEYINEDIYLLFEWLLKKNDTILNKIFNTSAIIDKYEKLKLDKTEHINIKNTIKTKIGKNLMMLLLIKTSFENFIDYLRDDITEIDYNYIWMMLTSDNKYINPLFKNGISINLFILEVDKYDINNNFNILCPRYYEYNKYLNIHSENIILIKNDKIFEPIVKCSKQDIVNRKYILDDEEFLIISKIKTMFDKCKLIHNRNNAFFLKSSKGKELATIKKILNNHLDKKDYYIKHLIVDNYFKVVAVMFNNKTIIGIKPSAINIDDIYRYDDGNIINDIDGLIIPGFNHIQNLKISFLEMYDNLIYFYENILSQPLKKIKNKKNYEIKFIRNGLMLVGLKINDNTVVPVNNIKLTEISSKYPNVNLIEVENNIIGIKINNDKVSLIESDNNENIDNNILFDIYDKNDSIYNLNKLTYNDESYELFKFEISNYINTSETNDKYKIMSIIKNYLYNNNDKYEKLYPIILKITDKISCIKDIRNEDYSNINLFKKKYIRTLCKDLDNQQCNENIFCCLDKNSCKYRFNLLNKNIFSNQLNDTKNIFINKIIIELVRNIRVRNDILNQSISELSEFIINNPEDVYIYNDNDIEKGIIDKIYRISNNNHHRNLKLFSEIDIENQEINIDINKYKSYNKLDNKWIDMLPNYWFDKYNLFILDDELNFFNIILLIINELKLDIINEDDIKIEIIKGIKSILNNDESELLHNINKNLFNYKDIEKILEIISYCYNINFIIIDEEEEDIKYLSNNKSSIYNSILYKTNNNYKLIVSINKTSNYKKLIISKIIDENIDNNSLSIMNTDLINFNRISNTFIFKDNDINDEFKSIIPLYDIYDKKVKKIITLKKKIKTKIIKLQK